MHMADALISPAVGGTLWAVSGGLLVFCARKVKQRAQDNLVPLMGLLGAFVFAAQMINFSIPGTGSSGHLGGGLILTLLLGPYAAFLVIASVLTIQAFFFADGGLLALGCNIFNLGFFPAFVAYPLIYRVMAKNNPGSLRAKVATLLAAVIGLQLGAFCVVLETLVSNISELQITTFTLMMLPVHLAIGIVEGVATVAVVAILARARPEALLVASAEQRSGSLQPVFIGLTVATLVIGGLGSWFASTHPDGLEWSIARVTGSEEVTREETGIHQTLAAFQGKTALLPDYGFKTDESENKIAETSETQAEPWPSVSAGTSLSGIAGGGLTMGLACLIGLALRLGSRRKKTGLII
jgi:cobalt/nickel transport system permease protein